MSLLILSSILAVITLSVVTYAGLSFRYSYQAIAAAGRGKTPPWLILLAEVLSALGLGVGVLLLTSPLALYLWIHGDHERYLWIIRGPAPYSQFGGGPFQLWMGVCLLLLGLLVMSGGITLRWWFWTQLKERIEDRT